MMHALAYVTVHIVHTIYTSCMPYHASRDEIVQNHGGEGEDLGTRLLTTYVTEDVYACMHVIISLLPSPSKPPS